MPVCIRVTGLTKTVPMYLQRRNRILRQSPAIRSLVAETILHPADFIAPLFIAEGENYKVEIPSMPGIDFYQV